jgi:phage-related protein
LRQAERELSEFSKEARIDTYALFKRLMEGEVLSMPISRPLSSIARGLHELRLSYGSGELRVFYAIRPKDAVYVLHAGAKKRQTMDAKTKALIVGRMRAEGIL